MSRYPDILPKAQAQFPKSANRQVQIQAAWKAEDATSGASRPAPNGNDGWTPVNHAATRAAVEKLRAQGFTWVNLATSGCANPFKDIRIDELLSY